jgi:hypothetical protein
MLMECFTFRLKQKCMHGEGGHRNRSHSDCTNVVHLIQFLIHHQNNLLDFINQHRRKILCIEIEQEKKSEENHSTCISHRKRNILQLGDERNFKQNLFSLVRERKMSGKTIDENGAMMHKGRLCK